MAAEERRDAQGAAGRLPSQGGHRRAGRGPARPLRRQAAHRPLRRLSAPDGLLGRDDAGRLLPDRRRRLEGRDLPASSRRTRRARRRTRAGPATSIPKALIVARYFAKEQAAIDQLAAELEGVTARLAELEEEHGGEDGAFAELDKVNKANVAARLKEIKGDKDAKDEAAVLNEWLKLSGEEADLKKRLKEAEAALDAKAYAKYPKLTEAEIKTLVVDDKWLAALDAAIHGEMDRVSQQLTQRVKELAERYETPLPQMVSRVAELEAKVNRHLERMGFAWK